MSLPPGFLEELRSRVSIARVVGRSVTWDLRKSNQGKGDFWAPCPFHQEKTASFHVDDRKGYYYCFGCHAKGDALTFLRETQNMAFMEAVETLAREAGMAMPAPDPVQREKADRNATLAEVMERAVRFFRLQLAAGAGAEARAYLDRRGLGQAARDQWEIGFAPDSRTALFQYLTQAGVPADQIVEAGLCARPDGGGTPFDRFRGRVMFPIRDARGRCIAFGGRALADGARAKYLNSPDTPLFDKGRTLFNVGPARTACGKDLPLIVAEGYMDVIALVGAGFATAVAPLGTAITEQQLAMMWRMDREPVIALDGDKAGLRAGYRVAELALPLLGPEQSLRFALLPGGQDPDDLIKAQGAPAMRTVLDAAIPLADLLWQRETEGQVFDSPERKAGLKKRLMDLAAKIADTELRKQYQRSFSDRCYDFFRPEPRRRGMAPRAPEAPLAGTRGSALALAPEDRVDDLRLSAILTTLAAHPALIDDFADKLATLDIARADLDALRCLLLAALTETPLPDAATLASRAGETMAGVMAQPFLLTRPLVEARADRAAAQRLLAHEVRVLTALRGRQREVADAMDEIEALADEGLTWRLRQAQIEGDRARRVDLSETESARPDEADGGSALDRLIAQEIWVKKRKSNLSYVPPPPESGEND